jgi:transposase
LREISKDSLYRCLDRALEHRPALFQHLRARWQDLFGTKFDVLLYDLTSTYFESDPPFPQDDKRRFGSSRDHRPDCVQVVVALVVTPEGYPLAYEILPGNTSDKTTLAAFLEKIEKLHGKAGRIWVMDRGIPTEAVLEQMRRSDPKVFYLVGTPKSRLRPIFHQKESRIEAHIFVAFLAYCLSLTLRGQTRKLAGGLSARAVLDQFGALQMVEVRFPTTDGRTLIFARYTQPEKEQRMLLAQLGWKLPEQPPPRITPQGQMIPD